MNNENKTRPWSKYSKENIEIQKKNKEKAAGMTQKDSLETKIKKNKKQEEKNEKKLEKLVGSLKDDSEFLEFLKANKAIKSKENIWKNDIVLDLQHEEKNGEQAEINEALPQKLDQNSSESSKNEAKKLDEIEGDFENGRLYIRNLHYGCKENDLEELFSPYGPLVEVNMPIDSFSKKPKGFAYITCMFPEKAVKAFTDLDGKIFQGRMLHILPGKTKKEETDETQAENMNFKKKKELELKKKAQSNQNWNSLFINADSVANLMAARYNVDKSELFDVHSSKNKKSAGNSIAVKLAVGETQIVNEMRDFLIRNGIKLDAFESSDITQRSKTTILIKNLPNSTTENELRELFNKQKINDNIKRLIMPEYGVACLIEFNERQEARDAFKKLAYKKFKTQPLYLEWAPDDIFDVDPKEREELEKKAEEKQNKVNKINLELKTELVIYLKNRKLKSRRKKKKLRMFRKNLMMKATKKTQLYL